MDACPVNVTVLGTNNRVAFTDQVAPAVSRPLVRSSEFGDKGHKSLIEEVTPDFHASATPDEMVARIRESCDANFSGVIPQMLPSRFSVQSRPYVDFGLPKY
jgi:hypothetical protein